MTLAIVFRSCNLSLRFPLPADNDLTCLASGVAAIVTAATKYPEGSFDNPSPTHAAIHSTTQTGTLWNAELQASSKGLQHTLHADGRLLVPCFLYDRLVAGGVARLDLR